MKLQETNTGQYIMTVPKPLVQAIGLKKGDDLIVQINTRGNLEIIKVVKA